MIRFATLALAALVFVSAPVFAQDAAPLTATDAFAAEPAPLTAEESAALAAALQYDPLNPSAPAKPLKAAAPPQPKTFDMTRTAQPYGSETYSLKRTLPALNARVGADLGTGADPVPYYVPRRPLAVPEGNTGAAWASVDVANGASIDARIDPSADQSRLATTLRRTVPLGGKYSLTLENSSGITNNSGAPGTTAFGGLPMTTLPQMPDTAPAQAWNDQPSVKFDVLSTGTSFSAGLARSSADPVTHNRIGAEQKIYGPLNINTAVTDVGEPTENRSIGANFKLTW